MATIDRRVFLKASASALPVFVQQGTPASAEQNCTTSGTSTYPFGPPAGPTFEKIELRLHQWQQQNPEVFKLSVAGKSVDGRPVYVAQITDPGTQDDDKEHFFLTALHAGQERGGATGTLYLMQWLLSGDPLAKEILRKQIIIAMPVVNPDSYVKWATTNGLANALGEDSYTMWGINGPLHPDRCPEAVAVWHVMDKLQAEVHSDIHGKSSPFPGVYAIEESGRAYSNFSLRPYHHEINQLMDEAGLEAGYPSDQLESDAERIFGGGQLDIISEKVWDGYRSSGVGRSKADTTRAGTQRVYAALYGYNRFHTMMLANESAWEHSAFCASPPLTRGGEPDLAG